MKTKIQKLSYVILSLLVFTSCNEDKKCSDEFVVSYQRMGDAFEALYKPLSGSFEVNALSESIDLFLASQKDVSCEFKGKTITPTEEAEMMKASLSSFRLQEQPKSFETFAKRLVPKVIYGEDNRTEVSNSSVKFQDWAGSTMVQISPDEWDSNFKFTSKTYGQEFSLCPGERFEDQLSVGRCSGFLVAPDVVVTAGHCMQSQNDCDRFKWVLDFKDNAQGTSSDKVYGCKEIVNQNLDSETQLDYAVIQLDRPVTGRKFFRIRSSGNVSVNASLVLIGYPSGISAKVADGAQVRSNDETHFFKTNTDSFGGNSGSAVINSSTGVVEGILVRGDEDFDIVDGPDGNR
ncbi:MAG: serine protease, partial [Halobacteriovoraceae bacterium]|nr:serine protease [Halobacteriovoraceae bacterium]